MTLNKSISHFNLTFWLDMVLHSFSFQVQVVSIRCNRNTSKKSYLLLNLNFNLKFIIKYSYSARCITFPIVCKTSENSTSKLFFQFCLIIKLKYFTFSSLFLLLQDIDILTAQRSCYKLMFKRDFFIKLFITDFNSHSLSKCFIQMKSYFFFFGP